MIRVLQPLPAYREDLGRAPGRVSFGGIDGLWIAAVQAIELIVSGQAEERCARLRLLGEHLRAAAEEFSAPATRAEPSLHAVRSLVTELEAYAGPESDEAFAGAYLRMIEQMTDAGANHLSLAAAAHLLRAFPRTSPRLQARIVSHQGRVARQLGDLPAANGFFELVIDMGRDAHDREIEARGLYGSAAVAMMRGNHPLGGRLYGESLSAATEAASEELVGLAHRGLMIVRATAGDFDTAIRHAVEAFKRCPDRPASRAELLDNIAAVCADNGHHAAALAAYVVAAREAGAQRLVLVSLGGAALAAARCGEVDLLEIVGRHVEDEIARGAPPFETATALLDLARAHHPRAPDRVRAYAGRVMAIAAQHEFYEMQFAADAIGADAVAPPARVAPWSLSEVSADFLEEITVLAHRPDESGLHIYHGMT